MRRAEIERVGIQLPVLPTIVLGALPGRPDWAERLERAGLDVVSSGAGEDTPETFRAVRAAVPHRPVKAVAGDPEALAAAGCRLIEGRRAPAGAYLLGPDEAVVTAVDSSPDVEDPSDVAAKVLDALAVTPASALWVAAGPGLDRLDPEIAGAKVAALALGVRLARLVLSKSQMGE